MQILVDIYNFLIVLDLLFLLGMGVWFSYRLKKYLNSKTYNEKQMHQQKMLKPGFLILLGIIVLAMLMAFLTVFTGN